MERKRSRWADFDPSEVDVDQHGFLKYNGKEEPYPGKYNKRATQLNQDGSVKGTKTTKGNRGGYRQGAGRPKGSKTRHDVLLNKFLAKVVNDVAASLPEGEELTSLRCFQALYRNPRVPWPVRQAAMTRALPYEYARLKAEEPDNSENVNTGENRERATAEIRQRLTSKLVQAASGSIKPASTVAH
jgi:hypothetical protein